MSVLQQMALFMSPMSMAASEDLSHGPRLLTPTKFRRRLREAATQTSAGLRRRGGGFTSAASLGASLGASRARYVTRGVGLGV